MLTGFAYGQGWQLALALQMETFTRTSETVALLRFSASPTQWSLPALAVLRGRGEHAI
jgi:hypothetical protein